MSSENGRGRLAGKTAVITGGTTGIGLATARAFIAQGAHVIVTGQNQERLDKAAQELGPRAMPVRADVRAPADLDELAARTRDAFGELDVLFANAGLGQFAPIEAADEAFYDVQFDVNVKGVFFTVQKLVGLMPAGASIVLNASAVNQKGAPGGAVYYATKAAVRSFARSLAAELGPRRIRVNAVSPGIVLTEFQGKMGQPQEALTAFIESVKAAAPLGREGLTEEIAQAVVFLASDESSYVTATDLTVDGGFMNV